MATGDVRLRIWILCGVLLLPALAGAQPGARVPRDTAQQGREQAAGAPSLGRPADASRSETTRDPDLLRLQGGLRPEQGQRWYLRAHGLRFGAR